MLIIPGFVLVESSGEMLPDGKMSFPLPMELRELLLDSAEIKCSRMSGDRSFLSHSTDTLTEEKSVVAGSRAGTRGGELEELQVEKFKSLTRSEVGEHLAAKSDDTDGLLAATETVSK